MSHKAGYVNIIGNPNVGKSTLMNVLLGEQLSIATPKAQTTRHRILGILNSDDYQIVFSDTPGVIEPAYALQKSMMDFVRSTFDDTDLIIYMTEPGEKQLKDPELYEKLKLMSFPMLLVINKIDLTNQEELNNIVEYWQDEFPRAEIYPISAQHGANIDVLLQRVVSHLPESPPFFDKEHLSDRNERFFVEEMVREQILLHYSKEIPYAVEVQVQEFKEEPGIIKIRAEIFTERNSQKGIIVGAGGKMIKMVGTAARKKMEKFFAKKVFLELHVKVRKNWRSSEQELRRFGYKH